MFLPLSKSVPLALSAPACYRCKAPALTFGSNHRCGFITQSRWRGHQHHDGGDFRYDFSRLFAEILLSRVLEHARRIITPLVSGIVVTLIGLTLIQVGLVSMGGGYAAMGDGTFGSLDKLALAGTVLGLIVILNRSKTHTFAWLRS